MREYPLTQVDQEDIDVIGMVNRAFYDGFIVGICNNKEAFDNITPEEYKYAAITAIQALAKLQGRPDPIEERLKEFQEVYHQDMRKAAQRQAENGAAKPIRAAISSMLPLIQDTDKLREVLRFVTEIYCRPGRGKPADRV